MSKVNINGVWKDIDKAFVNIGGIWKEVEKMFCNIGGAWKEVEGLINGRMFATYFTSSSEWRFCESNIATFAIINQQPTSAYYPKGVGRIDDKLVAFDRVLAKGVVQLINTSTFAVISNLFSSPEYQEYDGDDYYTYNPPFTGVGSIGDILYTPFKYKIHGINVQERNKITYAVISVKSANENWSSDVAGTAVIGNSIYMYTNSNNWFEVEKVNYTKISSRIYTAVGVREVPVFTGLGNGTIYGSSIAGAAANVYARLEINEGTLSTVTTTPISLKYFRAVILPI